MNGGGQAHEYVAPEAGFVLDAHARGPLEDVIGVSAADFFKELVHILVVFDAIEVQTDPICGRIGVS